MGWGSLPVYAVIAVTSAQIAHHSIQCRIPDISVSRLTNMVQRWRVTGEAVMGNFALLKVGFDRVQLSYIVNLIRIKV